MRVDATQAINRVSPLIPPTQAGHLKSRSRRINDIKATFISLRAEPRLPTFFFGKRANNRTRFVRHASRELLNSLQRGFRAPDGMRAPIYAARAGWTQPCTVRIIALKTIRNHVACVSKNQMSPPINFSFCALFAVPFAVLPSYLYRFSVFSNQPQTEVLN